MISRLSYLFVLAILLFSFNYCSNPTEPINEDFDMPLSVGNSWNYYFFSGAGDISILNSITGTTDVNGIEGFQFNSFWLFDNDVCYEIDGTIYGYNTAEERDVDVLLPSNEPVNYTWLQNNDQFEWKILDKSDQVTVTAGTFNCIKLSCRQIEDAEPYLYVWWSNGVGLIKYSSDDSDNPEWGEVLTSYSVNQL